MDDPLTRIQREISEVVQRENELKNGYVKNGTNSIRSISPDDNNNMKYIKDDTRPGLLQRAHSTSHLTYNSTPQQMPKRFPDQRGIMQRFIKSRGRLQSIQPQQDPAAVVWTQARARSIDHTETIKMDPAKMTRKGFVPVEERIQKELREMHNRETELRAYRRKAFATSIPNLLSILDNNYSDDDDFNSISPTSTPVLRSARSFAQLCELDSIPSDTVSAPPSLRPAVSLAKLCDESLDDEDVPKSKNLIAKFESIIQKNRPPKLALAGPITTNGNHL